MAEKKEITYRVTQELGVLSKGASGWQKEINIVSWNEGTEKYDIREWNEDKSKMSKGITLTEDEAKVLLKILKGKIK